MLETARAYRRVLKRPVKAIQRLRPRGLTLLGAATGAWFAVALLALGLGAVQLPPGQIARMLLYSLGIAWQEADWVRSHEVILFHLRLPRVILGGLVGAALGLSGAVLQGLFRNPMAGPFVLGVSSGASVGAVLSMVLGVSVHAFGLRAVPLMAFGTALGTVLLVYNLARVKGRVPTGTLLLAGIAISSFLSAVVSLLLVFSEEKVAMILFWLMGGLGRADWASITAALPYFVLGAVVTLIYARDLNALLLGEESAQHLGVSVERVKRTLLLAVSLMTAAAVSVSGIIGFVGLIIPHAVRMLIGPDHRLLAPMSALVGGMFLTAADTLARTAVAPSEIPVGVITALCGAPFFLWLLRKRRVSMM